MYSYPTAKRFTGTTPQTSGFDFGKREGCGYNCFFKYEIIYASGECTSDDDWHNVGIPATILQEIEKTSKGKYGWHFDVVRNIKYAKITFEDEDDALWFRLRISNEN